MFATAALCPSTAQSNGSLYGIDEVLEVARHGAKMGCKEALFTLGEKPELRYKQRGRAG